jgi:hypothetical protein
MKYKKETTKKEVRKTTEKFIQDKRDSKLFYRENSDEWNLSAISNAANDEYILEKLVDKAKIKIHVESEMYKAKQRKAQVSYILLMSNFVILAKLEVLKRI